MIVTRSLSVLTILHSVPPPNLPPVPPLELNCLIDGDDASHIFPVKIAMTESVGTLKKLIKEEKKVVLEHIDPDALKLFKVSITVDAGFKENVGKVELRDEELSSVVRLSKLFAVDPEGGHLHILIVSDPPPVSANMSLNFPNLTCHSL